MDFIAGIFIGLAIGSTLSNPNIQEGAIQFVRGERFNPFPEFENNITLYKCPAENVDNNDHNSDDHNSDDHDSDDELDQIFKEEEADRNDINIPSLLEKALEHKDEETKFAQAVSSGSGNYLTSGQMKQLKDQRDASRFRFSDRETTALKKYFAGLILGKKSFIAKTILERKGFEICTGDPSGYRSNRVFVTIVNSEVDSIDCIGGYSKVFSATIVAETIDGGVERHINSESRCSTLSLMTPHSALNSKARKRMAEQKTKSSDNDDKIN